jgi:protein LTV1
LFQLALLDDKFEEFFDAYDDENLGGLDCEEIEGCKPETSEVMKQVLSNFEREQKLERQLLERTAELGNLIANVDVDEDEKEVVAVDEAANCEDRFDCESIISTYSNIYNHPKLISEPRRIQVPFVLLQKLLITFQSRRCLLEKSLTLLYF